MTAVSDETVERCVKVMIETLSKPVPDGIPYYQEAVVRAILAEAALSAGPVAQEPVAWQYRYKLPYNIWSTWQPIERSTFELLVPNEQMQSRRLYTSPPAPAASVGAEGK